MVGPTRKVVKKVVKRKKVAAMPSFIQSGKPKGTAKVVDPLIQKKPRNFGIGQDIQPVRDLTRFVRWPKYIRLQRQKAILQQRIKVPPPINQFRSNLLDRQTATQLFRLLDKYKPEDKTQKKQRLQATAEAKVEGKKAAPSKRPPTVRLGVNQVTTLVEQKRAQLVVVAADCDPLEIVLHLPALCRKMGIPYCIIKGGRSRLGTVARRKSVACLALVDAKPEDRSALTKLVETIRTNFNDRADEIRRHWGGGIVGSKSQAKVSKIQRAKEREVSAAKASAHLGSAL
ncbi:60S ribosomal protein L7a [Halotydeus destructor]|nr:60S ribosomal protein L7a [Halotydeus destructor]